MFSVRLLEMIQNHAEGLAASVVVDLQRNSKTPSYGRLSAHALHHNVHAVFHDFGEWLEYKPDETMEGWYKKLGRKRLAQGVPLAELVWALTLTKYHLQDFVRSASLVDSALEIYQEMELQRLVNRFFDKAMYYSVEGYTEGDRTPLQAVHGALRPEAPRSH